MEETMDNPTRLKILKKTLEVLGSKGENWDQGAYFMGADGALIASTPSTPGEDLYMEPSRFCLAGAVCQAAKDVGYIKARSGEVADKLTGDVSLSRLVSTMSGPSGGYLNVPEFNDANERTFEEVKALVETRIAQIEEKM